MALSPRALSEAELQALEAEIALGVASAQQHQQQSEPPRRDQRRRPLSAVATTRRGAHGAAAAATARHDPMLDPALARLDDWRLVQLAKEVEADAADAAAERMRRAKRAEARAALDMQVLPRPLCDVGARGGCSLTWRCLKWIGDRMHLRVPFVLLCEGRFTTAAACVFVCVRVIVCAGRGTGRKRCAVSCGRRSRAAGGGSRGPPDTRADARRHKSTRDGAVEGGAGKKPRIAEVCVDAYERFCVCLGARVCVCVCRPPGPPGRRWRANHGGMRSPWGCRAAKLARLEAQREAAAADVAQMHAKLSVRRGRRRAELTCVNAPAAAVVAQNLEARETEAIASRARARRAVEACNNDLVAMRAAAKWQVKSLDAKHAEDFSALVEREEAARAERQRRLREKYVYGLLLCAAAACFCCFFVVVAAAACCCCFSGSAGTSVTLAAAAAVAALRYRLPLPHDPTLPLGRACTSSCKLCLRRRGVL